jgi:hypothetical protein
VSPRPRAVTDEDLIAAATVIGRLGPGTLNAGRPRQGSSRMEIAGSFRKPSTQQVVARAQR